MYMMIHLTLVQCLGELNQLKVDGLNGHFFLLTHFFQDMKHVTSTR